MRFSIIIPTLNEGANLRYTLEHLIDSIDYLSQVEIIISDGGSNDDSFQISQHYPVSFIEAPRGRAMQMNSAVQHSMGDWLVFLHADTRLPRDWMALIEQSNARWGRFDIRLSGKHWLLRIVEKAMNLRSQKTGIATGDQVLFFKREFFQQLGGFPEIPLMEDIAISKRARQVSAPACIAQPVISSSRRWEKHGILRTIVLMWALRLAYWLGVKPDTLHRLYYP